MKRSSATAGILAALVLLAAHAVAQNGRTSPVTEAHLTQVRGLFKTNGIARGQVVRDRQGRIELKGAFENEREVDRAFSLAQTVVGVRWVSPVTPEQIKVKEWEECFSRLFGGGACGAAPFPPAPVASAGDERPPGPVTQKYALVVGVGQFRNKIQPLLYANKDAYDFYTYLVDPVGGNFKRENVVLLRDDKATRGAIVKVLKEIQNQARPDDLVVLYISSHGTPPDKFAGVHLVTYDAEVMPRERIWDTALTEVILRDFIQGVRAKRLIVLMDACYSNGAYTGIPGFLPPGGKSLGEGVDEGFGRSQRHMAKRLLGAKDVFVDAAGPSGATVAESGLSTGWGKVLISASDAGERSWESDRLRNGVFTRFLLDGLNTNRGAVREAFDYAKPMVRQQVKREKGDDIEQNPQLTPSRPNWNMSLAR